MSGVLRAAVEGLPASMRYDGVGPRVLLSDVLALIPEGAVLVTEESLRTWLLEALEGTTCVLYDGRPWSHDYLVKSILRHLREGM